MFVGGMCAPRRRIAARLLAASKHEGRSGRHAHAQPLSSPLRLAVLLALAQLVDAEQDAEERQAPEEDTKYRAYYHPEGHIGRRDDSRVGGVEARRA